MKCFRCNGLTSLINFGGSPSTECSQCGYIQIVPDALSKIVLSQFDNSIASTKDEKAHVNLLAHYRRMKTFDDILNKRDSIMFSRDSGVFKAKDDAYTHRYFHSLKREQFNIVYMGDL